MTLYKENKSLKDEKYDKTSPLVLYNLEEVEDGGHDSSGLCIITHASVEQLLSCGSVIAYSGRRY